MRALLILLAALLALFFSHVGARELDVEHSLDGGKTFSPAGVLLSDRDPGFTRRALTEAELGALKALAAGGSARWHGPHATPIPLSLGAAVAWHGMAVSSVACPCNKSA